MYLNRGQASADRAGLITFNLYNPDGSAARVVGVIPDTIGRGGTVTTNSLMTREHSDVRYAQPWQVISQNPATYSGDLNDLFEANTSATYFVLNGAPNAPAAVNGTLLVQTSPINPLFCTQTFIEVTGTGTDPRMWVRARSNGNWSNWNEGGGAGGGSGLFAEVATTSGSSFDFENIPAEVRQIEIMLDEVSRSAGQILFQLGTSAGLLTTGYGSIAQQGTGWVRSTTGIIINNTAAGDKMTGVMTLSRMAGNKWLAVHTFARDVFSNLNNSYGTGRVELPGELDRVRLTGTTAGNFSNGAASVRWIK